MSERLLRMAEVRHRTGLPKTTVLRMVERGHFPPPRRPFGGYKILLWVESEVVEWIEGQKVSAA